MNHLFTPYRLKGLDLKNRVVMSPMCQFSVFNRDGIATDWHYVHYVSRAIGGAGLILMEMTAVEPIGRIEDTDLGIWSDEHIAPLARIAEACHRHGAKIGIQIGHSGRKARHGDTPVGPSPIRFSDRFPVPRELSTDEVRQLVEKFRLAVRRAVRAGMDTIELHGAHGYIIHQFHSPKSNRRTDEYGELTRFGKEVIQAARSEMPSDMPLIIRISGKEYAEGGYDIDEAIRLAGEYHAAGADMIDVSSGGDGPIGAEGRPGTHAGYQLPLARKIKEALGVPVMAVGRLDDPVLANAVIGNGEADLIAVGRGMLRNPYWTLEAAMRLGKETGIPQQYIKAFER